MRNNSLKKKKKKTRKKDALDYLCEIFKPEQHYVVIIIIAIIIKSIEVIMTLCSALRRMTLMFTTCTCKVYSIRQTLCVNVTQ